MRTTLDAVGLLPIVGVLKFGDEAATLVKRGSKTVKSTNGFARKQVDDIAREFGISGVERREFGKFIDKEKERVGRKGADNYTYQELREFAEEFLSHGRR